MFRELPTLGLEVLLVLVSLDSLFTLLRTLHQLTAQYFHGQFVEGLDMVWEHGQLMLSRDDIHLVQHCKQVRFPRPNSMGRHKVFIQKVHKMFVCELCALGTATAGEKEPGAMVYNLDDHNSAGVLILGLPNFLFYVFPPPVWRLLKCWQIYGS